MAAQQETIVGTLPVAEAEIPRRRFLLEQMRKAHADQPELLKGIEENLRLLDQGLTRFVVVTTGIDYDTYIRSQSWRIRADAAKRRAGGRCQVCNGADRLNAHHRTYERIGHEQDDDLIVLCEDCHTLFHRNGKLQR